MKKIINFDPQGMKSLHFFVEGLNFPVAIGTYSEWEEVQVSYLSSNIKSGSFNTEAICRWCISHQIQYRIVYPISKKVILHNPYKYSLKENWIILSKKRSRYWNIHSNSDFCALCLIIICRYKFKNIFNLTIQSCTKSGENSSI